MSFPSYYFILLKVGRRLRKLEQFKKQMGQFENFTVIYDGLVDDATKIICSARNEIDLYWKQIIDIKTKNSTVALKGAPFNMTQSLSGNGLLNYLTSTKRVMARNSEVSVPHVPPRHRISLPVKYMHSILQSASSTIRTDISIRLFDFERNVQHCWSEVITTADYKYVWEQFHEYLTSAMNYYINDPVGMSRALITILKMIQVWDQCACRQHPLLRTHKLGIETGFFKMLLVVSKKELEIVNQLEEYFLSRERAPNSCLLENKPTHVSFSVNFAQQSPDMESLRKIILEEGMQRAAEKTLEVRKARSLCESLRTIISRMNCKYYKNHDDREEHSSSCERCCLENEVNKNLISI